MAARRGPAARAAAAILASAAVMAVSPVVAAARPAAATTSAAVPGTASGGDWAQGGAQLASRGVVVNYASPSAPKLPKVPAGAFLVANAGTGAVLAAKDAHGWFRPASTLKVLTAISLIPVLNPDATTVASRQAVHTEPNDVGLIAGRRYPISGLFQALLTISANDAAVALTQATGSFSRGMALINAKAHQLQAYDTVARQPNGLDAPGQHTSAYDEALIARAALASPAFLGYDRTVAARFEVKPKHWVTLVNQNQLLTTYAGDIGGKLGWTSAAGATYVGMARRNGITLIVTILHCPPLTEFKYATRLLNWGFAANSKVRPVGTLVSPLPPAVTGKPHVTRHQTPAAARRPAGAAGGASGDGPVAVAVGFLLLASLIVSGLVIYHRRSATAAGRPGRRGAS